MAPPLVFFSFVDLTDPDQHRAYNEWHQLDHQPENLALPGVAWGNRWARRGEHGAAGAAAETYAGVDYVAMYWFHPPAEESVVAWDRLGEDSFQWGRGPLIPGVQRRLLAFFRPVQGYASGSALVSADAVPYRPHQGVHLMLTRYAEPHGPAAHAQFGWQDRTLLPRLMEVDGVAGAWTFALTSHQRHGSLPMGGEQEDAPGSLRIRLLYLDGEPLATSRSVVTAEEELTAAGRGRPRPDGEEVLLSSTLTTIIPWQDW